MITISLFETSSKNWGKIEQEVGKLGYRPFVDSAPILERPLAQKAGLGWTGKHSLILDKENGSWFFLGNYWLIFPYPLMNQAKINAASVQRV